MFNCSSFSEFVLVNQNIIVYFGYTCMTKQHVEAELKQEEQIKT